MLFGTTGPCSMCGETTGNISAIGGLFEQWMCKACDRKMRDKDVR